LKFGLTVAVLTGKKKFHLLSAEEENISFSIERRNILFFFSLDKILVLIGIVFIVQSVGQVAELCQVCGCRFN